MSKMCRQSVRTHLQLTFDDNGYSKVVGGLENLRTAAIILFAAGLLSALAILVLLLYFFIVKQKKRTAIERSLGMSKNQCSDVACFGRGGLERCGGDFGHRPRAQCCSTKCRRSI